VGHVHSGGFQKGKRKKREVDVVFSTIGIKLIRGGEKEKGGRGGKNIGAK